MERRLTAVLIADVVGYSRLSQIDEEGTRARFQADLSEVFGPKIAEHHGRLIKTMGDGLLVEFHSVVDALRCAVEVQQRKAERKAAVAPKLGLDFRIGVNLGDVIVEGNDIHGDGVNIADRIQGLAEPGGIAISGTAYDHVKTKLPVGFVSLGEQKVRNIAEPVRIYRVALDPAKAGKTIGIHTNARRWGVPIVGAMIVVAIAAVAWQLLEPPAAKFDPSNQITGIDGPASLVILPLANLSDDREQGYLADGLTEDLTTDLARVPGLFVISRNAALSFKGKVSKPAEIAAELNVRYILEGSVRKTGDAIRINAQLIDGKTGGHLWAERFDGAWTDILTVQNKIMTSVAAVLHLKPELSQSGVDKPGGTNVPAAYDFYLQGLEYKHRDAPEDKAKAASLFREAVRLDPNFGQAWAMLAWVYWDSYGNSAAAEALGTSNFEMLPHAREYLKESEKNPSSLSHSLLAQLLVYESKSDEAIIAARRGVELDPSDPASYEQLSMALSFNGRGTEAVAPIETAIRIDPRWTDDRRFILALAEFVQGRVADAAAALAKVEKPSTVCMFLAVATEAQLGHDVAATRLAEPESAAGRTQVSGLFALTEFPFKNALDRNRLLDGLQKARVPIVPFGFDWDAPERLSGDEIKSLIFGHQALGILVETGDAYTRATDSEGAMSVTNGPWSDHGFSRIEGDMICSWVTTRGRYCSAIYRNPTGKFETKNEYFWVNHFNRYEFSIVK
jgi:adenylate cyclase